MSASSSAVTLTAIVTGASRGIGLAIARALVADGFRVGMLARSADELRAHADVLGERALAMPCDVSDIDAVHKTIMRITAAFAGAPDVIVNNAGVFKLATVDATDPRDFRASLDVNLFAPFLFARAFLAAMRERRSGHIVTIGSMADRNIFPENGAYSASKFGARALHEVLRAELRGSGVRTTLVSPAPVDTSLWDEIDPDARDGFTPRSEMLRSEDVADAVRYVVSRPLDVNVDELRLSRT
jgi:NADP-dependent 3-hydroxy acid dehydrogenase YdfG